MPRITVPSQFGEKFNEDGHDLSENYKTSWGALSKDLHKRIYYIHDFEGLVLKQFDPQWGLVLYQLNYSQISSQTLVWICLWGLDEITIYLSNQST